MFHRQQQKNRWCGTRMSIGRSQSGQASMLEGVVSLAIVVPIIVGGALLVIFAGACMLFLQKVEFAAQMGASYAANLLSSQCFFLGVQITDPSAAVSTSADAKQIQTAVQTIMQQLGVPGVTIGGKVGTVSSSVLTVGSGSSAVQFAQVSISPISFTFPGAPVGTPPFSLGTTTAMAPISTASQTPLALLTLQEFSSADVCVGSGGGIGNTFFLPAYDLSPSFSFATPIGRSAHLSAHINSASCLHIGQIPGSTRCGCPFSGGTRFTFLNAANDAN